MKVRKKPVEVEAVQYAPHDKGLFAGEIPEWLATACNDGTIAGSTHDLTIQTFEGPMRASPGDWIIKGVKNEMYACKPDIFEATYERVE